ncbi:hypothetical protein BDZ45DRAFT_604423 [Acephala macrosclerotiorum]|nr:hypothetical protein BDZ45DRAFT_604423 [Acephala macrosclerotiorum]
MNTPTDSQNAGEYMYKKTSGTISLQPDASPVSFDSALVMASCTKLITTIAALRSVERALPHFS